MPARIPAPPDPVALAVGPISIHWYGVCYAIGLLIAFLIMTSEARRRGLSTRILDNGAVVVIAAGLLGARLYHVIDQWDRYSGDLWAVIRPPWGVQIQCAHRVEPWTCAAYPEATTGFQPLFLYESLSGLLGAVFLLWLARRGGARLRSGDLFLVWLAWYCAVRFALETQRTGNWALDGIPTAMLVAAVLGGGALILLAWRHRPGSGRDVPARVP